jgi:hypothetical protein
MIYYEVRICSHIEHNLILINTRSLLHTLNKNENNI